MKLFFINISLIVLFHISFVSVTSEELTEGSPCNADGFPGVCRLWRKCLTFAMDLQDFIYPPICAFHGSEPIICCTSCSYNLTTEIDISKAVLDPFGLHWPLDKIAGVHWKTDQKSWNKCIDYYMELPYELKSGMVGKVCKYWDKGKQCYSNSMKGSQGQGIEAYRSEYPHMALLGYGMSLSSVQYLCGGSIINDRYVLTAAHCISTPKAGPVTFVALGMLKRSDPEHLWQRHMVLSVIPYPEYRSPHKYHDIALIQTIRRIEFNDNVLPVCLPSTSLPLNVEIAVATGWGDLGPDKPPADTLQAMYLTKFNDIECLEHFPPSRLLRSGFDPTTQLCYGHHKKATDTCKGDSGGPLQISGQLQPAVHTIIGVTSFGYKCGRKGRPAVYTNVAAYVPWIDSIVWD